MSYHVILYQSIYSVVHRSYQTTSHYNVLLLAIEIHRVLRNRGIQNRFILILVKDLRGSMAVMTHKSTVRFPLKRLHHKGTFHRKRAQFGNILSNHLLGKGLAGTLPGMVMMCHTQ